jgi:hypothetical protein
MPGREPGSEQSPAHPSPRDAALAAAVFAACLLFVFLGIWRQGFTEFVPSVERPGTFGVLTEADVRLAVWGTSRNAWVLTHAPWHFFDAEPCYPTPRSLTLGHPMLSLGLLGVPLRLLAPDPVATYNAVFAVVILANALAMYLLVVQWTGSPAAGIAAGALFAFHPVALDRVMHPQIYDLSWTLLALWFAQRLCTGRRWRDALGLGAALVVQMGGSFYAAAIGALVCAPFFAWLLWRSRGVRPAHAALVCGIALLGAALVYGPYLAARALQDFERPDKYYLAWSALLPGGARDPGLWLWALAACGLALGRPRGGSAVGDPRAALVAAALLAALAAAGGIAGSRFFYAALSWIPGFGSVRHPSLLAAGTHLALSALAGLGVAALVRACGPRRGRVAAGTLVAATLATVLEPTPLSGAQTRLYALRARPPQEEIDFYEALGSRGNAGPVLELLVSRVAPELRSRSVLLTAYHHRPVSTCYNSIEPRGGAEIERLIAALPDRAAQQRARELGFTTIVIQHPPRNAEMQAVRASFERAQAEVPVPLLRPLYSTPWFSAFTLGGP